MKRLLVPLTLVILLTSCAPAAPVTPTVTAVPPTATAVPPTQTLTTVPTSTPEPTATSEPTKVPMPEGWTAVAETREIGGRQVVLNEKGDTATRIDGEWYPVDARGCFYKEFFDPEIQKKDPKIMELVDKINSEESFSVLGSDFFQRHLAGSLVARTKSGEFPLLNEKSVDAIIFNQKLCLNTQTNEWSHVIDFVIPTDVKQMPKDVVMMRGVVGWIREGDYVSFTYKQSSSRGTQPGHKNLRDLSGTTARKAESMKEAFDLWKDLIAGKEQVGVRMPMALYAGQNKPITSQNHDEYVTKITSEAFLRDPVHWSESISDPEFVRWALEDNNQIRYTSDEKNKNDAFINHRSEFWKHFGQQVAEGSMPEWVIRLVEVQDK